MAGHASFLPSAPPFPSSLLASPISCRSSVAHNQFLLTSIPSPLTATVRPTSKSLQIPRFRFSLSNLQYIPHVVLKAAFEAEADVGLVECYGRGCRPVYDDTCSTVCDDCEVDGESLCIGLRERVGRSSPLDLCKFGRELQGFWVDKETAEKYYQTVMKIQPRNSKLLAEYAQFVWKVLANDVKAEQLFEEAMKESPNDSELLASYAYFLWHTEG